MGKSHVLVIPYAAQGHVIPMMEFSLCLVKHGIKVTFVNTKFNHERIMKALPETDKAQELVNMVSIPDGLEPWEDRNHLRELIESISRVVPVELEALIRNIIATETQKITCIIADASMMWALQVAQTLGISSTAFWPEAASLLASSLSIPELVDDEL